MAKEASRRVSSALEFSESLQKVLRGQPIAIFDENRIRPRIQRALRALENGNYQMASDILKDLEESGHIDPALVPLRRRAAEALSRKTIAELLEQARAAFAEDEHALALQNVEKILRLDATNDAALEIKRAIQQEIEAHQEEDYLQSASRSYTIPSTPQQVVEIDRLTPATTEVEGSDALQKQERVARATRIASMAEAEVDTQKRLNSFCQADEALPRVCMFDELSVRSQPAIVDDAVTLGHGHEEADGDPEALEQRQMLSAIHERHSGVNHEIERRSVASAEIHATLTVENRQSNADENEFSPPPMVCPVLASVGSSKHRPVSDQLTRESGGIRSHLRVIRSWDVLRVRFVGNMRFQAGRPKSILAIVIMFAIMLTGDGAVHGGRGRAIYQPASLLTAQQKLPAAGPNSGATHVAPESQPTSARIHVVSDLKTGTLVIDDRSFPGASNLTSTTSELPVGDHRVMLSDGSAEARLNVVIQPGGMPELGLVAAKGLVAITAVTDGRLLEITCTNPPDRMTIDGKAPSVAPSGHYQVDHLASGRHTLVLYDGKENHNLVIETDGGSSIWVWLYEERSVGSLLVVTGLDTFQVLLDGQLYHGAIRNGAMLIPNLNSKAYRVGVTAEGFEPAERQIEVQKGGTMKQTFALKEKPKFASLVIRDALPHTEIFLDGDLAGSTDSDGTFTSEKIRVGNHESN
jgi:hypothetical protein